MASFSNWLRYLLIVIALGMFSCIYFGYYVILKPNLLVGQPECSFIIPHHSSFETLKKKLRQENILQTSYSFELIAQLLKYDRYIKPGHYVLKSNMSNWEAVRLLRSGAQTPIKIILHNLSTKQELAERITQKIGITAKTFEKLLHDPPFLEAHHFTVDNILAMFIPNTYEIYWTITPEKLFKRMKKEYEKFWNAERLTQAKQLKLAPIEVIILASIVQEEHAKPKDAAKIAGVFINRLRKRMRLQSCTTVQHVIGEDHKRRILHKDTKIDSRYNTYKNRRLPPGPITIPSMDTIEAVLNFEQHRFLYFCAKEDFSGEHHFSKTLKEHLHYARQYQRALNRAKIYR